MRVGTFISVRTEPRRKVVPKIKASTSTAYMAAAALAVAGAAEASGATPSPLLWQVERILIDCRVGGTAAGTDTGRALCADIASEARRQAGRPVAALRGVADADPLSDLTLVVAASLTHSASGRYRLGLAVRAVRRGFPVDTGVHRERAEIASGGARPPIAAALRRVLSVTPARARVVPPIPRS